MGRPRKYSDEELLEWIHVWVDLYGVPPSELDFNGGPMPSYSTYRWRFGSFPNAVRAAGYTPRGDAE
ncbi:MAG: hypothetical protein R3324_01540 [Halobacteriales archaeon]|nr:hypothetical protein [Halobacteriales archaeon]